MKRKALVLCAVLTALLLIPLASHALSTEDATSPIYLDTPCSVSFEYSSDAIVFSDVEIKLYKAADVSSDFRYTLTDSFKPTALEVNGISSQAEWNTIKNTVESHIAANGIECTYQTKTNKLGIARFDNIEAGLYFVPSLAVNDGGFRYYFASALISLPDLCDDGTWSYDVEAKPKPDVRPPSSTDLEYRVLKLWKGDEGNIRPASVTVDILRDGQLERTVVLSSENDWSFRWYAEDDGSTWTVAEKEIPDGYRVTVDKNETVFTLTNTYGTPPDIPDTGDTANLMLYVLLLTGAGICLVIVGLKLKDEK